MQNHRDLFINEKDLLLNFTTSANGSNALTMQTDLKVYLNGNLTHARKDGPGKIYLAKGSNSIADEGAIKLASIIKNGMPYQKLILILHNQNIHDAGIKAICDAIEFLLKSTQPPTLIHFDLSTKQGYWKQIYDLPNQMSNVGLESIAKIIKLAPAGSEFNLCGGIFGISGLKAIANAIQNGRENLTIMFAEDSLDLSNETATVIADMIKSSKSGLHLGLNKMSGVTPQALQYIADAVKTSRPGLKLDLSDNSLSNACSDIIAEMIKSVPSQTYLNFSRNKFESTDLEKIAAVIDAAPEGFSIDLSHNDKGIYSRWDFNNHYPIPHKGIELIAQSLLSNTKIQHIELRTSTELYVYDNDEDKRTSFSKKQKDFGLIYICCFRNRLLDKYKHQLDIVTQIKKISSEAGCYISSPQAENKTNRFTNTFNESTPDFSRLEDLQLFTRHLDDVKTLLAKNDEHSPLYRMQNNS